jgi:branched-chain amino acid transport system permease protein
MMATGLSLVWSTLGIFNFAHGAFMALGAYIAWQVGDGAGFGLGPQLGIVAAVVLLVGVGCATDVLLVRPFQKRGNLVLIAVITTLAALTFLENGMQIAWGPRLKQLPPLVEGNVSILGVPISAHEAVIIVLSPAVLLLLWLFLKYTMLGTAIRAVGQNQESARLMGMNVSRLYMAAFGLSAALAALAGILLGARTFIDPTMGSDPMTKALIVAIFGGLGSLLGTIGGAYIIGLLEALSVYLVGLYWTPAVLFIVMIAVLLVRPTGLFGRK